MKQHQNLFLRTHIYSLLIILISLFWYYAEIPLISKYLLDVESKTYDWLFIGRNSLNLDPKVPKNILIVGIDATSITKVGVPWPWPRQFHASLVDALSKAGAKYIFFDIIFDTISPLSLQTQDIQGLETIAKTSFDAGVEDDKLFAESIARAMNVFLACEAEPLSNSNYHVVNPISTFVKAINNDSSFLGNSSVTYDHDNFVRKARLIFPEFSKDPPINSSISLRILQKYLNKQAQIQSNYSIQIGDKKLPEEFLINFFGPSETITTIPYWKALELIYKGDTSIFKDKIILIGRTKLKASIDPFRSVRSPDAFPTPFAALTPNFSGVELQATILGNLLENNYIVKVNKILLLVISILVGIAGSFLIARFRQKLVLCFYLSLIFALFYLIAAFVLFVFYKVSIPPTFTIYGIILPIFFINFLDQYFIVDRERRRQSKIFRQLVPTQVADEIELMDQEQLALGGTKREITVLFTDIENFTGLCERYPPEIIVNVINRFFTEMVKIIHKYNGLVDKFIGDAIMAMWGSPKVLERSLQAKLAAQCSISMKQELKMLNQMWKNVGLDESLNIRVGINTNEAITGNIGSIQRMQFSAIGDGVNVASRLEATNKVYRTSILISENTSKLISGEFHTREIDTVIVPGKDSPINIYELIEPENYNETLSKDYTTALKNYREKNHDKAIELWQSCLKINPKDNPSKIMLERTLKLKASKIPEDWQPVWVIENK